MSSTLSGLPFSTLRRPRLSPKVTVGKREQGHNLHATRTRQVTTRPRALYQVFPHERKGRVRALPTTHVRGSQATMLASTWHSENACVSTLQLAGSSFTHGAHVCGTVFAWLGCLEEHVKGISSIHGRRRVGANVEQCVVKRKLATFSTIVLKGPSHTACLHSVKPFTRLLEVNKMLILYPSLRSA